MGCVFIVRLRAAAWVGQVVGVRGTIATNFYAGAVF